MNYFDCDCNWTRAHNHLVDKRTLNHLAKLARWVYLKWVYLKNGLSEKAVVLIA